MSDHPSTYKGDANHTDAIAWDDHAQLLPVSRKDGVLARANAARTGTFAEMIRHLAALDESTRSDYVIEKAGDREYSAAEAVELAARTDFPAQRGDEHSD